MGAMNQPIPWGQNLVLPTYCFGKHTVFNWCCLHMLIIWFTLWNGLARGQSCMLQAGSWNPNFEFYTVHLPLPLHIFTFLTANCIQNRVLGDANILGSPRWSSESTKILGPQHAKMGGSRSNSVSVVGDVVSCIVLGWRGWCKMDPSEDLRSRKVRMDQLNPIWLVVWNMTFIFPYIVNSNSNWLIFFRGIGTPNQQLISSPFITLQVFPSLDASISGSQLSFGGAQPAEESCPGLGDRHRDEPKDSDNSGEDLVMFLFGKAPLSIHKLILNPHASNLLVMMTWGVDEQQLGRNHLVVMRCPVANVNQWPRELVHSHALEPWILLIQHEVWMPFSQVVFSFNQGGCTVVYPMTDKPHKTNGEAQICCIDLYP